MREWQTSQKEAAAFNSKVMNAIFNVVSMEEFKRISNVEVTYTAWNILETMHEGTKAVNINKLQQLTTLLVIHSTGCISNLIPRRLRMNSGEERSLLLSISGYLVVIVTLYVIERT